MSREPSKNIFIHGIPLNLEKNGLINIFCKAGEVEEAKIIQPHPSSNSTMTYGFIRYKNTTQAAMAIEMFDNYKIDNHRLSVKFGRVNRENGDERPKSTVGNNLAVEDDDWETVDRNSIPPKSRLPSKNSTSDLSSTKPQNFDIDFNTPFDMSKPYARRLVEEYLKKIDDFNERHGPKKACVSPMKPAKEKPQIGQIYKVNITHVNTPSNFFVQLLSTVNSTANMLNNLDNHYRNEIVDDPELKNGCSSLEIDDLCAVYYSPDSRWYRGYILNKTKRTYCLSLIDFGDKIEIPFENVRMLHEQFSAAPKGSIRCKLHNLRYLRNQTEWSPKAIEILENLTNVQQDIKSDSSESSMLIKIIDIHQLDPSSNRFEEIYSVDLCFENEWVSNFLIAENLAIKIEDRDEVKNMNLYYKNQEQYEIYSSSKLLAIKNDSNNIGNNNNNVDEDQTFIDESNQGLNLTFTTGSFYNQIDFDMSDSVSTIETGPDFMRRLELHNKALSKLMASNNKRNKMFNGKFKVWKKRDLKPILQPYVCGQIFDVKISSVISSQKFYVQRVDKLDSLKYLEDCIQKFVDVLLKEEPTLDDFYSFQEQTNKLDAVLVKSSSDSKWRRAILIEKCNQNSLVDELNEALEIKDVSKMLNKEYYTFFLIDWGIEDLKVRYPNQSDLFILPLNEKLVHLGPFALECSLDQSKIKTRLKYGQTIVRESIKFETLLKKYITDKQMTARISHFSTVRYDSQAIVELFFFKDEFEKLVQSEADFNDSDPNDTFSSSFSNLSHAKNLSAHDLNSMLNCINFISKIMSKDIDKIKPDEEKTPNKTSSEIKSSVQETHITTNTKISSQSIQQEERHSQLISDSSSITKTAQIVKSTSFLQPTKLPIKPVTIETLKKGLFTVQLQHYDDTYVDHHFYVTLKENLDSLLKLDQILQQEVKDSKKFTYITQLDQLKVGDMMEALFDIDEKWYRVSVRHVNNIDNYFDLYFLDFGNSQRIQADSSLFKNGKLIRIRNYYDSQEESNIFDLKYQAIKCRYAVYTNNKCDIKYKNAQEFLDLILEQQLDEFEVRVINICEDYDKDKFELTRISYGIYLSIKDENNNDQIDDDEVSFILDKKETLVKPQAVYGSPKKVEPHTEQEIELLNSYNLKQHLMNDSDSLYLDVLKKDSNIPAILFLTQNTREFYVHVENHMINLIKSTNLMKSLLNNIPAPPIESSNNRPLYQLGDFVFVLHLDGWKRGIVVDMYHNKYGDNNIDDLSTSFSSQLNLRSENEQNSSFKSNTDGYTYTVYLVDYGSKETYITSKNMRPIKCILDKNVKTNLNQNELKSLIEYPFAAVCCEFDSNLIKDSIYNTEILKSIMKDYLSFTIRIKSVTKQDLFMAKLNPGDKEETCFKIRKYVISLYSNNLFLDDKFEKFTDKSAVVANLPPKPPMRVTPSPPPILIESKLEKDSQHQVNLAFIGEDGELYVSLFSRVENLSHLESKIKLNKNQIESNGAKLLNWLPNLGDLVLAKYYQDHDRQQLSTSHYDWYRALVTKIDLKKTPIRFEVLYLDYGNSQADLMLSDLVKLPNEYDLNKHEIFSYRVNLNNINLDLNNKHHEQVLKDFQDNETFLMKIIDNTKLDLNNLTQYDVEFWTPDQKICLNKLLDPKYKTHKIDTINLVNIYENFKNLNKIPFKISTKYTFTEKIDQEFYFVLEQDFDEREKLNLEINQYYTSKELAKETLPMEKIFKKNEYYACISENKWYRVKITSVVDDSISLFFIDYGYDEKIDRNSVNMRLRKLNQKFLKQPQFCFGAYLLDLKQNNRLVFDSKIDLDELNNVVEEFLSIDVDNLNINVHTKYDNDLFGVVVYNKEEKCLNKMFMEEVERLMRKKQPRPKLIKLTHGDMPKQRNLVVQPDKDTFMTYVQSMNYFYIFENEQVANLQLKVQDICQEILVQESNFDYDNSKDLPKIGDLCFGKYENDQMWYRCVITNLNSTNKNYELFFLDFGNVEITKREDMLFGFDQSHVDIFQKEQAAAYKCKLYDLVPANGKNTFDEDVNSKFKDLLDNNIFSIGVIRKNDENIYEIEMDELDSDRLEKQRVVVKHLHDHLIKAKMAEFPRFDVCLTNAKSKSQIDFYMKLLKRFNV